MKKMTRCNDLKTTCLAVLIIALSGICIESQAQERLYPNEATTYDGSFPQNYQLPQHALKPVYLSDFTDRAQKLKITTNRESAYNPIREVNRYVNTIKIENNGILMSQLHSRPNHWTYDAYADEYVYRTDYAHEATKPEDKGWHMLKREYYVDNEGTIEQDGYRDAKDHGYYNAESFFDLKCYGKETPNIKTLHETLNERNARYLTDGVRINGQPYQIGEWDDNLHSSEILVYRYDPAKPEQPMTLVAQVYFHGKIDPEEHFIDQNTTFSEYTSIDVRRFNQYDGNGNRYDQTEIFNGESRIRQGSPTNYSDNDEKLYFYRQGTTRWPWWQSVQDQLTLPEDNPFALPENYTTTFQLAFDEGVTAPRYYTLSEEEQASRIAQMRAFRNGHEAYFYNAAFTANIADKPAHDNDGDAYSGDLKELFDGIIITDVFEASTKANDQPASYEYIAVFHEYANPNLYAKGSSNNGEEHLCRQYEYPFVEYISNTAGVEVYKCESEIKENSYTKDEVDADLTRGLELDSWVYMTVMDLMYNNERINYYDMCSRWNGGISSPQALGYGEYNSGTENNYYTVKNSNGSNDYDPEADSFDIPDLTWEKRNGMLNRKEFVPVIHATTNNRVDWVRYSNSDNHTFTQDESSYGCDFKSPDDVLVTIEKDPDHDCYEAIATELGAPLNPGAWQEKSYPNDDHGAYSTFLKVKTLLSQGVEVYGARIWRVRHNVNNNEDEDRLIHSCFINENNEISRVMPQDMPYTLPTSCYFFPTIGDDKTLTIEFKDAFEDINIKETQTTLNVKYIVRFYGRLKNNHSNRGAEGEAIKDYFVDEHEIEASFNDSDINIITAVSTNHWNHAVTNVSYYDLTGRVSKRPFAGVNIVVTTYSNGIIDTCKKVF